MLPPLYIVELKECRILGGTRLVIPKDGVGLHDEMALPYADQYGVKLAQFIKARSGDVIELQPTKQLSLPIDVGILLSCDYDRNYFHWLIECLPKLLFINEYSELDGVPLIVDSGLHPNLYRALDFLNNNRRPIIQIDRGAIASVGQLIVPSDICRLLD